MTRREFREAIIKYLYSDIVGGELEIKESEEEIRPILMDIVLKSREIDEIISSCLTSWTIDRLNLVDLAIIRLATYEMKYLDIPKKIIINEALEITKKYSNLDDDSAKKFNNRLLENIKNKLEE